MPQLKPKKTRNLADKLLFNNAGNFFQVKNEMELNNEWQDFIETIAMDYALYGDIIDHIQRRKDILNAPCLEIMLVGECRQGNDEEAMSRLIDNNRKALTTTMLRRVVDNERANLLQRPTGIKLYIHLVGVTKRLEYPQLNTAKDLKHAPKSSFEKEFPCERILQSLLLEMGATERATPQRVLTFLVTYHKPVLNHPNDEKGSNYLHKLIRRTQQGDTGAANLIAHHLLHTKGRGDQISEDFIKDADKARYWLVPPVLEGHPGAANDLATFYFGGLEHYTNSDGTITKPERPIKNYKIGMELLEFADKMRYPEAAFNLGLKYAYGLIDDENAVFLGKDLLKAKKLFERALELGYPAEIVQPELDKVNKALQKPNETNKDTKATDSKTELKDQKISATAAAGTAAATSNPSGVASKDSSQNSAGQFERDLAEALEKSKVQYHAGTSSSSFFFDAKATGAKRKDTSAKTEITDLKTSTTTAGTAVATTNNPSSAAMAGGEASNKNSPLSSAEQFEKELAEALAESERMTFNR